MKKYLSIALGAIIGANLRLGISAVSSFMGFPFFLGTFLVNMSGAFIAGFIIHKIKSQSSHKSDFLMTGLLGSFTTFSMMTYEQYMLLSVGDYPTFLIYFAVNLAAGVLLASIGYRIGGRSG